MFVIFAVQSVGQYRVLLPSLVSFNHNICHRINCVGMKNTAFRVS